MKEINVVVKLPNCMPEVKLIPNTLESMQEIVGGYIETMLILQKENISTVTVFNEEGKLKGLEENVGIAGTIIVGPMIFLGSDGEAFHSLPDEDLTDLVDMLTHVEIESRIDTTLEKLLKGIFGLDQADMKHRCSECETYETCTLSVKQ